MNTVTGKKHTSDASVEQILNEGVSATQAFASGVPQQAAIGSKIIMGPSLVVSAAQRNALIGLLARLGGDQELDKSAILLAMMDSVYKTLKTVVDNLKPSDKEVELRRRRKEELEKQRRELENRQVTIEQAIIRFATLILDPADQKLLEDNLAKQRPVMA